MAEEKKAELDVVSEISTLSDRVLKNSATTKPYKYCLEGLKLACKDLLEKKEGE